MAKKIKVVVKQDPLLERVEELESDLRRLVTLIGSLLGRPFEALAREIVEKHQGKSA